MSSNSGAGRPGAEAGEQAGVVTGEQAEADATERPSVGVTDQAGAEAVAGTSAGTSAGTTAGVAVGMFRLSRFDEVSSTNEIVKRAIAGGEREGFAASARSQTGGYGRRGNAWASKPGGVYVSVLLEPARPAGETATLSLVAAIAVRRALVAFLPEEKGDVIKIKWPNDVVVMGSDLDEPLGSRHPFHKICGISLEQKGQAICMGIGVNVEPPVAHAGDNQAPSDKAVAASAPAASSPATALAPSDTSPAPQRNIPAYLCDLVREAGGFTPPTPDEVTDTLLRKLTGAYQQWRAAGFAAFRDEFMAHFALEGFKVRIDQAEGARAIRCAVVDVNNEGHLLVIPEGSKETVEVSAGTVTILA